MIREEYQVSEGMKIADIDPRKEQKKNCNTISDKARCIAGTVVEILLFPEQKEMKKPACCMTDALTGEEKAGIQLSGDRGTGL